MNLNDLIFDINNTLMNTMTLNVNCTRHANNPVAMNLDDLIFDINNSPMNAMTLNVNGTRHARNPTFR